MSTQKPMVEKKLYDIEVKIPIRKSIDLMNNTSYECPTEFNVLTKLKSCTDYRKELQESTDPLKYKFDLKPGPMCFMPGQMFQGLQMTVDRRPPVSLLEMEQTLQLMPLKEEEGHYVIGDIHKAKPPSMPAILSNRLVIPDCTDILRWQRTKIKKTDFPQVSQRMDKMGLYLTNYMRPGVDTKQEMKDLYKKYDQQQMNGQNIYGVGKFDKRPLKPGTNPKCTNADSDLDCMHVYGPDATRTGAVIDSTLTLTDLARNGLGDNGGSASGIGSGSGLGGNAGAKTVSVETRSVAATIDPNQTLTSLLKDVQTKAGCNARFYGYAPPTC